MSAPRLKVLLAALLLRSGEVVPAEDLIDRLWDTSPPDRARAALQASVTRLRRVLGRDGLVLHRGRGYMLEVPPGTADLQQFDALVAAARTAVAEGDNHAGLEALRGATTLWRGPILSDVESAVLHREDVPRLVERCLDAVEQRFELELAVGNHRGVVEELRQVTAAYPLREGLRAHLMQALYRSGRQAEALEVYRRTRALLQAELGLEPGYELRSLQEAILLGKADSRSPGSPPDTLLYQLPPATIDFVGRVDEIRQLECRLTVDGAVPITLVDGVAGVGKSTLAVHVAHQLRSRFPDGQLYVNLEGTGPTPRDPSEVLGELLQALGQAPSALPHSLGARAAAFRARLADRRVLILLDDAADTDQIAPLLPGTPGAALLVTSRRSLPELPGAYRLRLQPLTGQEGLTLLSRMLDERRMADERQVAEELVDLCGGLPLAIRIVGARLQPQPSMPLTALAVRLRDDVQRLDELSIGRLEFRSQLELAYSGLAAPVQLAFRRMGLLPPGPFAAWTLGVLCDGSDGERLAEQLTMTGMLEAVGADLSGRPRYRPHDLVAVYARELAAEDRDQAAYARLLDTLLHLAHGAYPQLTRVNEGLPPGVVQVDLPVLQVDVGSLTKDPDEWVHGERTLLLDVIARACRAGWYEKAAQLGDLVIPALAIRGSFGQLDHARRVIRDAAITAGDELVAARAETSRADLLLSGRVDQAAAAFESCVPVFRRLDRPRELVHSLTGLAFARIWQGLPATGYAEEAARIATAAGSPHMVVLALRTHGETLLADQPDAALPLFEKALVLARQSDGDQEAQRTILVRIVDCAIRLGDLDTAEATYAQAADLTDPGVNPLGFAWLLMHHSRIHRARGNHSDAIDELHRARDLMADAGDTRGVVTASLHLAATSLEAGDVTDATRLARSALADTTIPRLRARAQHLLNQAEAWHR